MILNKEGVHLKKLVLGGRLIDNIGALAVHFPNLEVLKLNKCMSLTDDGLLSILDITGSKLKVLDLSTTNISDFGSLTTTSLVNLEVLKLMYSPWDNPWMQNDRCLMNILNKTGNCLRSLNLSCNDSIRLGDTSYWAFSLPNLKELDMSICPDLDDFGVISFLNRVGTSLEFLYLSGVLIDLTHASYLTARFPSLKCLELNHCHYLKESRLISFLQKIEAPRIKYGSKKSTRKAPVVIQMFQDIVSSSCFRISRSFTI